MGISRCIIQFRDAIATCVVFVMCVSIAQADPISRQEADAWESHVRRLMNWDSSVDLKLEAQSRMAAAEKILSVNPNSRAERRDLADAFHTLGHMAEHEHRFEYAIAFHLKSLGGFLSSGLETRESWDDGTEHAKEHIFMDLYDEGVILERSGDLTNANRYFDSAAYFAYQTGIVRSLRHRTDRFDSRFDPLQRRLEAMVRKVVPKRLAIGQHIDQVFNEVQCKVLFGNPFSN